MVSKKPAVPTTKRSPNDDIDKTERVPDPDEQLEAIGRADLSVRSYWPLIRPLARELRKRGSMTMDDVRAWALDAGGVA